ncbi:MAG: hypothetical protein U0821_14365 [Chloroflexota bacterium]
MAKEYLVTLTPEERAALRAKLDAGGLSPRTVTRIRALLLSDQAPGGPARSDSQIVRAVGLHLVSVESLRKRFVRHGLDATVRGLPSTRTDLPNLDDRRITQMLALASGPPPDGEPRWTLGLLAREMVARGYVESISGERIRQILQDVGLTFELKGRRKRKLEDAGVARMIHLASGPPPDGERRWTLPLLASAMVSEGYVQSISTEWLRQLLAEVGFVLNPNPSSSEPDGVAATSSRRVESATS